MATTPKQRVKVDSRTGYVYVRLSNESVASSADIAPGIAVDYDKSGGVRGIEADSQATLDKLGIAKIVELAMKEKERAPSASEADGPPRK